MNFKRLLKCVNFFRDAGYRLRSSMILSFNEYAKSVSKTKFTNNLEYRGDLLLLCLASA